MRFTIREVGLLTLSVALALGWVTDHTLQNNWALWFLFELRGLWP